MLTYTREQKTNRNLLPDYPWFMTSFLHCIIVDYFKVAGPAKRSITGIPFIVDFLIQSLEYLPIDHLKVFIPTRDYLSDASNFLHSAWFCSQLCAIGVEIRSGGVDAAMARKCFQEVNSRALIL